MGAFNSWKEKTAIQTSIDGERTCQDTKSFKRRLCCCFAVSSDLLSIHLWLWQKEEIVSQKNKKHMVLCSCSHESNRILSCYEKKSSTLVPSVCGVNERVVNVSKRVYLICRESVPKTDPVHFNNMLTTGTLQHNSCLIQCCYSVKSYLKRSKLHLS